MLKAENLTRIFLSKSATSMAVQPASDDRISALGLKPVEAASSGLPDQIRRVLPFWAMSNFTSSSHFSSIVLDAIGQI